MPDDSSSHDSGQCPTNSIAEMGHSEAQWDIAELLNLTDIQLRLSSLTALGHPDSQIADALSINRKTLWRWKHLHDEYRQTLARARLQLHATAGDRCHSLLFRAASVLAEFLEDQLGPV